MRITTMIGLFLLALAPTAHAQSSPPSGEMHLQFLVAGRDQAIYIERMTPKVVGTTVEVWVFTALPDGKTSSGWWLKYVIDCPAQTVTVGNVSIVAKNFDLRRETPDTASPTRAIAPGSTDKSLANFFCTTDTISFNYPAVDGVRAAWTQAQQIFASAGPG
jgi:hypothetical protein